jgi:hypothetical protein
VCVVKSLLQRSEFSFSESSKQKQYWNFLFIIFFPDHDHRFVVKLHTYSTKKPIRHGRTSHIWPARVNRTKEKYVAEVEARVPQPKKHVPILF